MISRSILKTSKTCSTSKNWVLKWLDSGACKCLIDINISYIMA
jgi:hypothetical protein